MKQMLSRLLSLFVVMFTMCLSSFAGGGDDSGGETTPKTNYYTRVVVNAVGEGKVYAHSSSGTATGEGEYNTTFSLDESAEVDEGSAAPTFDNYIYAQANTGYEFAGWYTDEACTGEAVSTELVYHVEGLSGSTDENAPMTYTYWAKFVEIAAPFLSYGETRVYANLSTGSYKNESLLFKNLIGAIVYTSSNENVATVDAEGNVTFKKNGSAIITAETEGAAEPTSYVISVIDDVNAGITQVGNGDFEDWRNVTSSNHAPNNWNSFETAEGSMASWAGGQQVAMVEGGRPGSDGLYCVDIFCQSILGVPANGNLTLGCINAGSMTATDAANHNFSKITDPSKSETISKIPSAIKFWAKFVPNSTDYNARMAATVHDAYNYITHGQATSDTDENKAHAIAQAELNFPACEWTEITVPFVPTGNTTDGQMYIIVNFTTNETPGVGKAGDHLYIDDVELVYSDEPTPVVYNKYISVAVNNTYAAPQEASIEVTYNENSTIDFNLKNFALDNNGTPMYVGNINLLGLAIDKNGNFSFNGDIRIAEGDKEGVTTWLGPNLGDIPAVLEGTIKDGYFYVHIDINVGYPVEVEVGDLANATVSVSDALISTFCAPFTVAIPADYQSVVTASTVTGVEGNVLTLEPVANYVIPANTPVIVETPVANTLSVSGIYVKGTPVAGLLTGVYENTPAPVGSYVLQNLDKVGFYLVAEGNQPTVGANRCYLTVPAAGVKAFFLNGGDATGISGVDANVDADEAIYNLAGQRINKLQKGINIINGKKILK